VEEIKYDMNNKIPKPGTKIRIQSLNPPYVEQEAIVANPHEYYSQYIMGDFIVRLISNPKIMIEFDMDIGLSVGKRYKIVSIVGEE
jgi:hypothetical protein